MALSRSFPHVSLLHRPPRAQGNIVVSKPRIIAHRGDTSRFPENTLEALQAAAQSGVDGVELDVQFSSEGTPVVFHDRDLKRMTNQTGLVRDFSVAELKRLSVHEPKRWGMRFKEIRVLTLDEMAEALCNGPNVTVFIEIKRDSLLPNEIPGAVKRVIAASERLGSRRVIISFESRILRTARSLVGLPVGWVIKEWTNTERSRAEVLKPDFLFCDRRTLPPAPAKPWPGSWRWVVYEVNDPKDARALVHRGIDAVETANVEGMIAALRPKEPSTRETTDQR